ncbi:hypothetical protein [Boudabousia marimammalium]|uniref:hypothetical protein n=1 Tax=Boudabousia marimammalium TaxID=156892 RepID=UPI001177CEE1|nr:hypothetical protein [Boudabousia marimammalium]
MKAAFERLVPHVDANDPLNFLMLNWLAYRTTRARMPELSVKLWEMLDGKVGVSLWGLQGEDPLLAAGKARENGYREAYRRLHPLPEDNR